MRKYYLYYLKKRFPAILIAATIYMVLTLILLSTSNYVRSAWDSNGDKIIKPGDNPLTYLTTVICLLSTVLPVLEFNFKMKRRTVDLYYSLPVKKVKLFAAKYFLGLTEMLAVFIPQWLAVFLWVNNADHMFLMYYFWWYLLIAVILGILMFSFFAFFFTMASSTLDGVFFMILASCALCLVMNLGYAASYKNNTQLAFICDPLYYFPYSSLLQVNTVFYYLMCGDYFPKDEFVLNPLAVALFVILSVGFTVLFFIMNSNDHAEVSSDMSESWFGYRVLIPLYMGTIYTICGKFSALWVIAAMGGYIGYAIYRRTFKIKKLDIMVLAGSIIVGLTLGIIIVNFF